MATTAHLCVVCAPQEPECEWTDDTTVVVYLSMFTQVGPSTQVCVKAGVLKPAHWNNNCPCPVGTAEDDCYCAKEHCVGSTADKS